MHKQKLEEQKKKEKLEEIAEIKKAKIQEQQLNDKKKLKLERQHFYANLVRERARARARASERASERERCYQGIRGKEESALSCSLLLALALAEIPHL